MKLSKYIDHTLLKPQATEKDILKLIEEAKTYDFASVCVNPSWVKLAYENLKDTDVKVCTVVGFPLGATSTASKVYETKVAIEDGADEIDMVISVGQLKSGNDEYVKEEIKKIVEASKNRLVKVIIETCLLTEEEKVKACTFSKEAGADYVKTSTGFSTGGAKPEDIKLMRETVGKNMGVKASGGIHTREEMEVMIENGATRIGASCGVELVK
ncbi:deoxyribose-phosphate aldolase [Clostridium botulinum]|uniref:Deoxyribose-phosphate aldolase n=1 Tax=Clostridium botulinum (strain Okra / Type B1) TaxID=498213 RepID=DEOC_CLOBK|nr:deoxyribose-phosphate aldolase [Clostridium botulinum]B1ILA1.1 RecName: Full=Deoxyribose-phosphate aldolase; Short=DERA; AltName: Full=2-deoxy-D-ribose 5-phosphate aldolase; AltName: Full=Phosphodeoxyriboaldolase; Short=Deoxyriboaldolase [Clostridium botulinum B1 str. Okra]EKX79746.1 deoxyribose-phosphate aldolase [Clostridium botulinum CFSAN001628]ACA45338.1 deoxyribose-phosphate aldolase [Clostridium botulinum B1 str. Okra]KOM97391.1 deoxyribose-phosphate aldolase [Clostridium botulinum]K